LQISHALVAFTIHLHQSSRTGPTGNKCCYESHLFELTFRLVKLTSLNVPCLKTMFSCEHFNAVYAGLYFALQEGEDLQYFCSKRDSFRRWSCCSVLVEATPQCK